MAQNDRYSIISIGSKDDDDTVIQAGVSQQNRAELVNRAESKPLGATLVIESEGDVFSGKTNGDSQVEDLQASSTRKTKAEKTQEPKYQETTKEDLDSIKPMSSMQKGIIAIAIVSVVVFLLYYNFLR